MGNWKIGNLEYLKVGKLVDGKFEKVFYWLVTILLQLFIWSNVIFGIVLFISYGKEAKLGDLLVPTYMILFGVTLFGLVIVVNLAAVKIAELENKLKEK